LLHSGRLYHLTICTLHILYLFFSSLRYHELLLFIFKFTATTEIYTLSLHDALPILRTLLDHQRRALEAADTLDFASADYAFHARSEEHTSELQSRFDLVCRLLLEKKNKNLDYKI